MDEVIADLLSGYITFLDKHHAISMDRESFTQYYSWNKSGITKKARTQLFHDFYASEYFDTILPISGAFQAVNTLSKHYALHIITSRSDYLSEKTHAWINAYFPRMFQQIHFAEHTKNG